jgi:hypothetical protein
VKKQKLVSYENTTYNEYGIYVTSVDIIKIYIYKRYHIQKGNKVCCLWNILDH